MRLAPTYLARIFVAWPGGIAAAVRMLTWIPLRPASGCGTPLYRLPSMASCQMAAPFLVGPDVHGAEPRGCLVADFHLVSFPPALILLPRASRPPCIWPLALDCLGRESSGSNSPSVPRLPCSHAEILHCRACADTAFCPPGRLLACFRDLLQRPQVSPSILYGSHTSPRHAELLGAVSAEISSHLGRTGWTSSWTHQADSGCSSPGIIPESYLLELADHHPRRGRPLLTASKVRGHPLTLDRSPSCYASLSTPPLTSLFRAISGVAGGRRDFSGTVWRASGRPWPKPCRQQRLRRRHRGSAGSFSSASTGLPGSCRPCRDHV